MLKPKVSTVSQGRVYVRNNLCFHPYIVLAFSCMLKGPLSIDFGREKRDKKSTIIPRESRLLNRIRAADPLFILWDLQQTTKTGQPAPLPPPQLLGLSHPLSRHLGTCLGRPTFSFSPPASRPHRTSIKSRSLHPKELGKNV